MSFLGKHVGRHATTTFSLQLVILPEITCWKTNYNYIFIATCCRFCDNMLKDKLQVHFHCNLCRFCDNLLDDKLQLYFHCNLLSFWENMLENILQLHFHCNLLSFLGKHVGSHTTTTFSLQLVILPDIICRKTNYNYTCITICSRFCDNMLEDKLQLHFHCNLLSFCDNVLDDKLQLYFHCNLLSLLGKHVGRKATPTFSSQFVVVSVITGWKTNYNYIFIATCCRFGDNMLKDKLQVHFHCNLLSFLW